MFFLRMGHLAHLVPDEILRRLAGLLFGAEDMLYSQGIAVLFFLRLGHLAHEFPRRIVRRLAGLLFGAEDMLYSQGIAVLFFLRLGHLAHLFPRRIVRRLPSLLINPNPNAGSIAATLREVEEHLALLMNNDDKNVRKVQTITEIEEKLYGQNATEANKAHLSRALGRGNLKEMGIVAVGEHTAKVYGKRELGNINCSWKTKREDANSVIGSKRMCSKCLGTNQVVIYAACMVHGAHACRTCTNDLAKMDKRVCVHKTLFQ
jgi:hypothetical protein